MGESLKARAAILDRIGAERPYSQSRPLEIADVELERPGPGELLVRIVRAGICHSDLSVVNGSRPRPTPMALGHEAAAVVESCGPGVDDVVVGDHVVLTFLPSCGSCSECSSGRGALCGRGARANAAGELLRGGSRLSRAEQSIYHHLGISAFSDYAVIDRRSAVTIDADVPWDIAALFGCAVLTGAGAVLNTAGIRPGQSLTVFGLGGVGLAAVMTAVAAGAYPVIAVDPMPAKRKLAMNVGATRAIAPEDCTAGMSEIAVEAVGSARALQAAYAAIERGGVAVAVGLPHPDEQLSIPALSLAGEGKSLKGSYLGDSAPHRDIPRLIALWRGGRLPVEQLASATIGLDQINEAFDALADAATVRTLVDPHR